MIEIRVALAALCVLALWGCGGGSDTVVGSSAGRDVEVISSAQAKTCHFIGDVAARSNASESDDMYRTAEERVRALAAGKSGDAVYVRSVSAKSAPAGGVGTTEITAGVFDCRKAQK